MCVNRPEEMDDFEKALGRVLQRMDAPKGFAAQVAALVAADDEQERSRLRAMARPNDDEAVVRMGHPDGGSPDVGLPEVKHPDVTKPKAKLFVMPSAPVWMSGAIAAALVMGCLVAERVHVVRQQEQVAANERQFEEAMRVTNHALDQTQEQLAKAGLKLGE
jgi:hypothetical protein